MIMIFIRLSWMPYIRRLNVRTTLFEEFPLKKWVGIFLFETNSTRNGKVHDEKHQNGQSRERGLFLSDLNIRRKGCR